MKLLSKTTGINAICNHAIYVEEITADSVAHLIEILAIYYDNLKENKNGEKNNEHIHAK